MPDAIKKINGSGWILVIIAIVVQSVGFGWKLGVMEEKITTTQTQITEIKTEAKEHEKEIRKLLEE